MRIRLKPAILMSNDAEAKYKLFAPEDAKIERIIDSYTKPFSGIAKVTAATSESLSLGDITAVRGLWLSATKDCQVKLNGAAVPLQLRVAPAATGDSKAALVIEAEITSIEVTAGAEDLDVIYAVWGDAAP